MPKLILPARDLKAIIRERRRCGGDRYDEVWEGIYVMSPLADNEHQDVGRRLATAVEYGLGEDESILIYNGTNVSNDAGDWRNNYRCPDVAVFLPGNPAEDRSTHWLGGPDFAVEVLSKGDRSRKKFKFYREVGVRELLLVNRRPWALELYRSDGHEWSLVGLSNLDDPSALASEVLSLSFRIIPGKKRPRIEVIRDGVDRAWIA